MYDLIIIGGGASGLFCTINAPKKYKKLILEKQNQVGSKILLSGGGRCNFSNININPDRYFGENKKVLPSVFHKFDHQDMLKWLEGNNIQSQTEDNGRIVLKSGKSQELLDILVKKSEKNNVEIALNQTIIDIKKKGDIFIITTELEEFRCGKLVIATGGVSYPKTGTTGYGLSLAKEFNLEIIKPYPALCGIITKEDLRNLSGSSVLAVLSVLNNSKLIYNQKGNILFTHLGLSGPAIFNASSAIGEYLTRKGKNNTKYIQENINIKIEIQENNITKRLRQSGLLSETNEMDIKIEAIANIETAKVSGGGISMDEINPNFESKKIENLYFIGETLDITGQTGGFNLQRARSSGFVCGRSLVD